MDRLVPDSQFAQLLEFNEQTRRWAFCLLFGCFSRKERVSHPGPRALVGWGWGASMEVWGEGRGCVGGEWVPSQCLWSSSLDLWLWNGSKFAGSGNGPVCFAVCLDPR